MKIKIILVSFNIFLSSQIMGGQSFTEIYKDNNNRPYKSETHLDGRLNGVRCIYDEDALLFLYLYKKNKLVFVLDFAPYVCQLSGLFKEFEKNNLQRSEDFGPDNPDDPYDQPYEQKCVCMEFYDSGNVKCVGIALCDDDPIADYSFHGEQYVDFGKAEHYKFETENNIVYETLLDGRFNGAQVFLRKSTGLVEKINYYEQGDIKAQFLFREDNSIKSIVYEIEPADSSSGCKYKSKYIKYAPNGTKVQSTTLSFNELPQ